MSSFGPAAIYRGHSTTLTHVAPNLIHSYHSIELELSFDIKLNTQVYRSKYIATRIVTDACVGHKTHYEKKGTMM